MSILNDKGFTKKREEGRVYYRFVKALKDNPNKIVEYFDVQENYVGVFEEWLMASRGVRFYDQVWDWCWDIFNGDLLPDEKYIRYPEDIHQILITDNTGPQIMQPMLYQYAYADGNAETAVVVKKSIDQILLNRILVEIADKFNIPENWNSPRYCADKHRKYRHSNCLVKIDPVFQESGEKVYKEKTGQYSWKEHSITIFTVGVEIRENEFILHDLEAELISGGGIMLTEDGIGASKTNFQMVVEVEHKIDEEFIDEIREDNWTDDWFIRYWE